MNAAHNQCPDPDLLEAIAAGSPVGADFEVHVSRCPSCSEYLSLARFSNRFGTVLAGHDRPEADAFDSPRVHGYRILSEIARGGQGTVYRAEQSLTGKVVAIKILPFVSGQAARARLHREMQIIASLDHPAIVRLIDSIRLADGREALVMEHINGASITDWTRDAKPTQSERLRMLAEVAEGLQHAHQRGVVHRDLTPSNILIDEHGKPRLLDFGVARLTGGDASSRFRTRTGEFTGTLAYASPEQVSGDAAAIDPRSDVYSLGVIGYQVLSGSMPYPVDCPLDEIIRSITEFQPPRHHRTEFGTDAWTVLNKAMHKDPNQRYETAAAFAEDLWRAADGKAIDARATSPAYRLRVILRRNRLTVALVLLCLSAIGAITAISASRVNRTDDARVRGELATFIATGARERAERLLWQELDRTAPGRTNPIELMWNGAYDTRSLIWGFAEMQSDALCLAADRSFQSPPLSISAVDSGEFAIVAADRTVHRVRVTPRGLSLEQGPHLDPATRYARLVPDRDWIVATFSEDIRIIDSQTGGFIASRDLLRPSELVGLSAQSNTLALCYTDGTIETLSLPDFTVISTLKGIDGGQTVWLDPLQDSIWFLDTDGVLCSHNPLELTTEKHNFSVPAQMHQFSAEIQIVPSQGRAVVAHAGKVLVGEIDGQTSESSILLHSGYRMNLGFGPKSPVLTGQALGESSLRLWDTVTWRPVGALPGHSGSVLCSAISSDGQYCLTADSAGTLRLWALPGNGWRAELSTDSETVQDFSISRDGSFLLTPAGTEGVRHIDLNSPDHPTQTIPLNFSAARTAVHRSGRDLAATDSGGSVWIRSTRDGAVSDAVLTLAAGDTIAAARFCPVSPKLFIATQGGDLIEIDSTTASVTRRTQVAPEGRVSDLAISENGKRIAVCTRNGSLILIDGSSLAPQRTEPLTEKQLRSLSFEPHSDMVLCVGDSGQVISYDPRSRRVRRSESISQASLFEIAIHPNGRTAAIGDRTGLVHLIDATTLQPLGKLRASGSVMALAFTPDGNDLIVSGLEQPPQKWQLTKLVTPLNTIRPPRSR